MLVTGNKVSLYRQIAQTLKHRVRTGQYRRGTPLPSLRTLGEEFQVSPSVIYRAVRDLETQGIVQTHHGKEVRVADGDPCDQAAIIFGFIHPYAPTMTYHLQVLEHAGAAFADRTDFLVPRSSGDDAAVERKTAEHLVANGAKGLLLWPTNNDPNGEFFSQLSRKIPVVLIDRLLSGTDLPAVVHDYTGGGQQMTRYVLESLGKRRLLVLMDDLRISAYEELLGGIRTEAMDLGRPGDVTTVQLPLTRIIHNINRSDFADVDTYAPYVERLIREGGYDAVFASQGEFIEHVMVDTGLMDKLPPVQLVTIREKNINRRSRKCRSFGWLDLVTNTTQMFSTAADLVQRWVLSRQPATEHVRVKMELQFDKQ